MNIIVLIALIFLSFIPNAFAGLKATTNSGCTGGTCVANLPRFTIALNRVINNTGNARICIVGDSTDFGLGSSGTVSNNTANVTGSWPSQMSGRFTSDYGFKSHFNSFWGAGVNGQNYSNNDPRLVAGSSWTPSTILSAGGYMWQATTSTNSLAFTPNLPVSILRVVYPTNTGNGTLSIDVDGSNAVLVSENSVAGVTTTTVTTTLGSHTFNFKWSSGGTVYVIGAEAWDSSQSWVSVMNMAAPSLTAVQESTNSSPWSPSSSTLFSALSCDITLEGLGINDWNAAESIANFSTAVQTIISGASAGGSDVFIHSPVPENPASLSISNATQNTYVTALASLTITNSLQFNDVFTRWNSYAFSSPLSRYADGFVHPTFVGYQEQAVAFARALMPALQASNYSLLDSAISISSTGIVDITNTLQITLGPLNFLSAGSIGPSNSLISGGSSNDVAIRSNGNIILNGGFGTTAGTGIYVSGISGTVNNTSIGTSIANNKLTVYGNMAIGTGYAGATAPIDGEIISGNIGIGTNTPLQKLDVRGVVAATALISNGTQYTTSGAGCTVASAVGGATSGQFTANTTGTCTTTVTMNGATGITAPNGWHCDVVNRSTGIRAGETSSTVNGCTFAIATTSGNILTFAATPF